ncbi:hypothetical protein [Pontibacter pamirensis]|uniref:hypothetical protein n=1 Tax=Pontibacter pamirensis TaxID=2562824 RepID=UPI001F2B883D|nr:hypothetical protein [Pontibacter pamirensis]
MKQTKAIVEEITKINDPIAEKNVHKERYLGALKHNNGKLDEDELGQSLGFSKEYTDEIIEELLSDGKITVTCRYRPTEEKSGR